MIEREYGDSRLKVLSTRLRQFVADRNWDQFHDPKNLAMALASEVGELLAEFRWVETQSADTFAKTSGKREAIENEVGDIVISLMLFCERTDIDMIGAAERKLERNAISYPVATSRGRAERPGS